MIDFNFVSKLIIVWSSQGFKQRYGWCGTVLKWFESSQPYPVCRRIVYINESYSSVLVLSVGVPQGSVLGPVLWLMYTSPLNDVIKSSYINYHLNADDTQFYVAFKTNDVSSVKNRLENCVGDICRWLSRKDLKLNEQNWSCTHPFEISLWFFSGLREHWK